jgi:hypothetical protein
LAIDLITEHHECSHLLNFLYHLYDFTHIFVGIPQDLTPFLVLQRIYFQRLFGIHSQSITQR